MATNFRTRCWESRDSSTVVQFRTDVEPKVWMHTNIGWLPIGNTPDNEVEAEAFAVECAAGYKLVESPQDRAFYMAQ